MFENLIQEVLFNIPLIILSLGIFLIGIYGLWLTETKPRLLAFFFFMLVFPVGLRGLWGFIMHGFFPELAASIIGLQTSPYQFLLAGAYLGIGIAGLLSFGKSFEYCLATTICATCFLWGNVVSYMLYAASSDSFSLSTINSTFYADSLIPYLLFTVLFLMKKEETSS